MRLPTRLMAALCIGGVLVASASTASGAASAQSATDSRVAAEALLASSSAAIERYAAVGLNAAPNIRLSAAIAGTWAAADRAAALDSLATGEPVRVSRSRRTSAAPGWTAIPGGCALPYADAATWLGSAARQPAVRLWTGAEQINAYKPRLAAAWQSDPRGTLVLADRKAIRMATAVYNAVPADANEAFSNTVHIGYPWLVKNDPAAKAALEKLASRFLDSSFASWGEMFHASFVLWAAGAALNWTQPDGIRDKQQSDQLWVKWLGPYSCLLAKNDPLVRGASNVAVVTNSAIVMAAFADASTHPDIAAALVKSALTKIVPGLKLLAADGGTPEGPSYWNLQNVNVAGLYSTLYQVFGDRLPIKLPAMTKTAMWDYNIRANIPDGNYVQTYADSHEKKLRSTLPAWVAYRTGSPASVQLVREGTTSLGLELVWWPTQDPPAPQQKSMIFPTSGIASIHSGNATAWLKGATPVMTHSHLDGGTVGFVHDGVNWATDPGSGSYSLPGYFEVGPKGRRWTYFWPGARGHSTLRSPTGTGQVVGALAPLTRVSPLAASVNLRKILPGISTANRTISLSTSGELTMSDVVTSDAPIPLVWQWVTDATVQLSKSGATLTKSGKMLRIRFKGLPRNATISQVNPKVKAESGKALTVITISLPSVTNLSLTTTAS